MYHFWSFLAAAPHYRPKGSWVGTDLTDYLLAFLLATSKPVFSPGIANMHLYYIHLYSFLHVSVFAYHVFVFVLHVSVSFY